MFYKILALDTSAQVCSIALACTEKISSRHQIVERQQANLILPSIEQLLIEAEVKLQQLDAIAFSAGPGSFTGIRLAASVAQGLAFGLKIPIAPVSSLQVLAQGAYLDWRAKHVLVAVNAYVEEVYWGVYQLNDAGLMQAVIPDQRCKPQDVKAPPEVSWLGVGDGWALYPALLSQQIPQLRQIESSRQPRATEVLSLARQQLAQGICVAADQALPIYLYPAEQWRKSR